MATLTADPVIDYTARDFPTIRTHLQSFIQATREDLWTDFYESNLGIALLEMVAFVGDIVSHGQDVLAQEIYLSTARRQESALRFARSVGYVPVSARAAQTVVRSETLPSDVVLNGATIAAGTFITGANGLKYELVADYIITPGSSVLSLTLQEGTTYTDSFTPTRAARQEFVTSRAVVEDASWDVFIGSTAIPTNEWVQVGNVSFETSASETYEVWFDGDGKLHVVFGDGNSGKIPDDTVNIVYRTTNGASGNAATNTIKGSVQATVIGLGTTASIAVNNDQTPATGGTDRESVDEMRLSIPAFIRTLDEVRTVEDYADTTQNLGGVALVYADVPLSSYSGNIVRVHVWDTEQVNFTSTSPESAISSTLSYDRYTQVPANRVYAVQQYLRPRTTATVHNLVVRPTVSQVDLYLGRVAYNKTLFAAADVHEDIVEALVTLFEESTGFAIRIADIYDTLLSVPGVLHFTIERIVWEHIDWDNPPTVILEEFRTDQDPTGAVGGPFLPLQDLLVPGANDRVYYDDAYLYDNEVTYTTAVDNPNIQAINLRTLSFDLQTA